MTIAARRGQLTIAAATLVIAIGAGSWPSGEQARPAELAALDRHPAVEYASRPTSDVVARLRDDIAGGARTLARDDRTGYLLPVLQGLGVSTESQLLVFSKTGIQRRYTGPHTPRALYFNNVVAIGYNPGAPLLEIAAHDPQQGTVFYTVDQAARTPVFRRQTSCLACHVSEGTLRVPGMIARSQMVGEDGEPLARADVHTVNHTTPHTERWGGWFVTGAAGIPRYSPLGHLGNVTVGVHPTSGPAIISDRVLIDWLNSAPEARGYLSARSDLAALLVFDHQAHASNLMTRLNWESRVGAPAAAARVNELADYLLFVGEPAPVVAVTPRQGFAEQLASRAPTDSAGRSLADLDLERRLLRYPCSYMVYSEAFDGLPVAVRTAVYLRLFDILTAMGSGDRYAHLSEADRRAVLEILRQTKPGFAAAIAGLAVRAGSSSQASAGTN